MKDLHPHKVGLALGALFGGFHLLWILAVLIGLAQPILDFIYSIHFLNNPFTVAPFALVTAVELIIVTSVVGYIIGWIFAYLWNYMHGRK